MFSLVVNLVWLLYLSQNQVSQIQIWILVKKLSNVQWVFDVVFRTTWKADNFYFPTYFACRKIGDRTLKWSEVSSLSHVQLFATRWTVAHQALLSMGFSRQGYWSGLPFPSPGELPDPGIEPRSPALRAGALPSEPPGKPHYLLLYPPIF